MASKKKDDGLLSEENLKLAGKVILKVLPLLLLGTDVSGD